MNRGCDQQAKPRSILLPEEGDQLYEVCRLRLGNDEPVCLQWSYLPAKMCPVLLQQDLTSSLTHLLDERYGLKFWSAHVVLRARLVTYDFTFHLVALELVSRDFGSLKGKGGTLIRPIAQQAGSKDPRVGPNTRL